MNPVIGQASVILILAVIVFFAGRRTIRDIRDELAGRKSCAGCKGGCHGGSCETCQALEEFQAELAKRNAGTACKHEA